MFEGLLSLQHQNTHSLRLLPLYLNINIMHNTIQARFLPVLDHLFKLSLQGFVLQTRLSLN